MTFKAQILRSVVALRPSQWQLRYTYHMYVRVIHCCITNTTNLATYANIHLLSHSFWGQESWHGLAGSFAWSSHKFAWGCDLFSGLSWGRTRFRAHVVAESLHFSVGLLAGGCPQFSSLWAPPQNHWRRSSLLHPSQQGRESPSKTDMTVLCSLIIETAYYLCCIVLVRSRSWVLPHSRGGTYTKAWMPGSMDDWGPS